MHYLVVGRVKDYPKVENFAFGLLRHTFILGDGDRNYGKWENVTDEYCIYWRHTTILAHYIAEVVMRNIDGSKSLSDEELSNIQAMCANQHGFWIEEGNVYAQVSGYFDYIIPGGKYNMQTRKQKAKYKDVVAKFGQVDAYVLPDFECRFTKIKGVEECPFNDNDKVWVLDGYTYCEW